MQATTRYHALRSQSYEKSLESIQSAVLAPLAARESRFATTLCKKELRSLDSSAILDILSYTALSAYIPIFEQHQVDGAWLHSLIARSEDQVVPELLDETLRTVGVIDLSDRKRLILAVQFVNAQLDIGVLRASRLRKQEDETEDKLYIWSASRIYQFLKHAGLTTTAENLLRANVSGDVFLLLVSMDLEGLGVPGSEHARLMTLLTELRHKQHQPLWYAS